MKLVWDIWHQIPNRHATLEMLTQYSLWKIRVWKEGIRLTEATKIVTLTGLYGVADYTCFNEQGNSVIDHICIDERNKHCVRAMRNDREIMGRINTDHSMVSITLDIGTWRRVKNCRDQDNKKQMRWRKRIRLRLNKPSFCCRMLVFFVKHIHREIDEKL